MFGEYVTKNLMALNSMVPAPAIGIDLGTTYSCVAVYHQGEVKICPCFNSRSEETIPSYVRFDKNNPLKPVIGTAAKETVYDATETRENTLYDVKRLIGRRYDDKDVQKNLKRCNWPFEVRAGENGMAQIGVWEGADKRYYNPEEISAKVLYYLKRMAEDYLGLPKDSIKKVVITVPANFNDGQRQATEHAGKLAGFTEVILLNEPTAAAIAYTHEKERLSSETKKVLVFDFGGGTFDVCIMNISQRKVNVLATKGDMNLGGQDFDLNLMKFIATKFSDKYGKDRNDKMYFDFLRGMSSNVESIRTASYKSWGRLQTYCEKAKIALSAGDMEKISIDALYRNKNFNVQVSREEFENLNMPLFQKAIDLIDMAMNQVDPKVEKQDIDEIVLVGGSSRIPAVQEMLEDHFQVDALDKSIQPDHAVAHGAAIWAAIKFGKEETKREFGFEGIEDVISCAIGVAAVQDLTSPLKFSAIIPAFTKIPTRKMKKYFTVSDNQTAARISIYQGDSLILEENKPLGEFELKGLTPAPAGQTEVDVWMEISEAGILHVTGKSGGGDQKKENSLTVTEFKSRMSSDAIEASLAEETIRRDLQDNLESIEELEIKLGKVEGPHFTHAFKNYWNQMNRLKRTLNRWEAQISRFAGLQEQRQKLLEKVDMLVSEFRGKVHNDGRHCANCEIYFEI